MGTTRGVGRSCGPATTATIVTVLSFGTLYLLWLLVDLGSARPQALVSYLVLMLAPLVAAAACCRAGRKPADDPAGWGWLGVGCLVWAGGSMAVGVHQLLLHEVAPLVSVADIGFVGYALPAGIGVLRFGRPSTTLWSRWRLAMDCAVIAGSLMLMSAVWMLHPVLSGPRLGVSGWAALAYPLADVLLAAMIMGRWMALPDVRLPVGLLLSAGLLCLAVVDSAFVSLSYREAYHPGTPLDLGWYAAFGLITVAACTHTSTERTVRRTPTAVHLRQLLPSVVIGAAVISFLAVPSSLAEDHRWWLVLPVVACVLVRGITVVGDHVGTARGLSEAVQRRTTQLRRREQWWQDIVANLTDVVIVLGQDRRVLYCSSAVNAALGHMPDLDTADQLLTQVHPDDEAKVVEAIVPVFAGGGRPRGFVECRIKRVDDTFGWFEVQVVGQLHERELAGAVLTLHDVTERRELATRLQHQAHHDALTGLPNRALLSVRLQEALSGRDERPFGLLLVDLDDFKVINDQHGHPAGDRVLTVVGERLARMVRAGDTVARLGGDEFAHLVHGTEADLRAVAERLLVALGDEVAVGDRRFHVGASIGIVVAGPGDDENAPCLLSHADIALYEAKGRGKGCVVLIEGGRRDLAAQQVQLREQVAHPVLDQFHLAYQPVVDLRSGALAGVEALLRWEHPTLGNVPPDVFVPMAEHGGSIRDLGWFVLEEACRQLATWNRTTPHVRLALGVNVSVLQLDEPDFVGRLTRVVAAHGIDTGQVVIELTEQSLAVDFESAVEVVDQLRATGVSVAVDDYGTGYSSLRYLDRFDANVLKIDRSFVAKVVSSDHTQKIVRSVLQMAQALELDSVAEGIETVEQLAQVQAAGCDFGQGYLFSRPVPADEISSMLADPQLFAMTLVEAALSAPPRRA